jgi:ABC-2 type transport system permease protein
MWKQTLLFLRVEIISFLRNRWNLFWLVVMPIFTLLILSVMFGTRVGDRSKKQGFAVVAVRDLDGKRWASRVGVGVAAAGWMGPEKGADVIVEIPAGFSDALDAGQGASVKLVAKSKSRMKLGAVQGLMSSIVNDLNREIDPRANAILLDLPPVEVKPEEVVPVLGARRALSYEDYLVVGVVGLNVLTLALFTFGLGLTAQRASGVLRRLWLTPARTSSFLLAQTGVGLLTVLVTCSAILLVAALALGFRIPQWGRFLGVLGFGTLVFTAIGFAVAARTKDGKNAAMIVNLVYLPLMFLSSIYFPNTALGERTREVLNLLPLQPFVESLRSVAAGAPLSAYGHNLITLSVWMVVAAVLARGVFRWQT